MTEVKKLQFIFYSKSTKLYALFDDTKDGLIQGNILNSDSNACTLAGARILLSELYPDLEGSMLVGNKLIQEQSSYFIEKQQDLQNNWISLWTHSRYYELQEFLCEQQIYNKNDLSSYFFVIPLSETGEENLKFLRNVQMVSQNVITEKLLNLQLIDEEDIGTGISSLIERIDQFNEQEGTRDNTFIQFVNKEKDREYFQPGNAFVPVNAIYKGVFRRKFEHWHTCYVDRNKFPEEKLLNKVRAIIVPGSSAGAWENREWVKNLSSFLKKTHLQFPHIKFVGICFGFQILAQTFGGTVKQLEARKKDPNFHVIGNEKLEINSQFLSENFVKDILPSNIPSLHINKGHGDYVENLPSDFFDHMGSSGTAQNELCLSRDRRMLCFQGHPEYSYEYSRRLMTSFSLQNGKTPKEWNNHMTSPDFNELFSKPNDHDTFVRIINNFIRIG